MLFFCCCCCVLEPRWDWAFISFCALVCCIFFGLLSFRETFQAGFTELSSSFFATFIREVFKSKMVQRYSSNLWMGLRSTARRVSLVAALFCALSLIFLFRTNIDGSHTVAVFGLFFFDDVLGINFQDLSPCLLIMIFSLCPDVPIHLIKYIVRLSS